MYICKLRQINTVFLKWSFIYYIVIISWITFITLNPNYTGGMWGNQIHHLFAGTGLHSHVAVQLVTMRLVGLFWLTLWSPCRSVKFSVATAVDETAAQRREHLPARRKKRWNLTERHTSRLVGQAEWRPVCFRAAAVMRRWWLTVSCDLDPICRESPQPSISLLGNWIYFQVWAQSFAGEPRWSAASSNWGLAAGSDTENSFLT